MLSSQYLVPTPKQIEARKRHIEANKVNKKLIKYSDNDPATAMRRHAAMRQELLMSKIGYAKHMAF